MNPAPFSLAMRAHPRPRQFLRFVTLFCHEATSTPRAGAAKSLASVFLLATGLLATPGALAQVTSTLSVLHSFHDSDGASESFGNGLTLARTATSTEPPRLAARTPTANFSKCRPPGRSRSSTASTPRSMETSPTANWCWPATAISTAPLQATAPRRRPIPRPSDTGPSSGSRQAEH